MSVIEKMILNFKRTLKFTARSLAPSPARWLTGEPTNEHENGRYGVDINRKADQLLMWWEPEIPQR
jgi:hypothetical protein